MGKLPIDPVNRLHTRPLQAVRLNRIYKAIFYENRRIPREKNLSKRQRLIIFDEYRKGIPGFADTGTKNMCNTTFSKVHNLFRGAIVKRLKPYHNSALLIIPFLLNK